MFRFPCSVLNGGQLCGSRVTGTFLRAVHSSSNDLLLPCEMQWPGVWHNFSVSGLRFLIDSPSEKCA